MEYTKERKKEELREQLRKLEKEQEEFEYNTKRVFLEIRHMYRDVWNIQDIFLMRYWSLQIC